MCGQHKRLKEWNQITFEFSEGGITVRVQKVYAWVCPAGREVAFTPKTVEELHRIAREALEPA